MNRIFFILILALLNSCSKEKSIERKLNGNWQFTRVSIQDSEGFLYEDSSPNGELFFDIENNGVAGKVNFNYSNISSSYFFDSLELNQFTYTLDSKLERFYAEKGGSFYDFRILSLTRTDLQIEYYDTIKYQMKRFVLVKK
jgi:hypothetical protein